MIDSHTHLYLPDYQPEGGDEAVRRSLEAGLRGVMFPNVDLSTIEPMNQLALKFPGRIDKAIGIHPTEITPSWREDMKSIEQELACGDYRAVGEVGIDFHWNKSFRREQKDAFVYQCQLAREASLPVIIHCRDGLDTIMECFDRMPELPRAVFHSFTGTPDELHAIISRGDFYIGINGIVTFKNSSLRDVLPLIPIERLLLETDAPYLAPVPRRGQRNESSFLPFTAACIADNLNIPLDKLSTITDNNYFNLFRDSTISRD